MNGTTMFQGNPPTSSSGDYDLLTEQRCHHTVASPPIKVGCKFLFWGIIFWRNTDQNIQGRRVIQLWTLIIFSLSSSLRSGTKIQAYALSFMPKRHWQAIIVGRKKQNYRAHSVDVWNDASMVQPRNKERSCVRGMLCKSAVSYPSVTWLHPFPQESERERYGERERERDRQR